MASTTSDRLAGVTASLASKAPVKAASTANLTLSGEQTIDGISIVADDRVLVKDQTDGIENGVYDAASGAWTRSKDFDGTRDVTTGTFVVVGQGTAGAGTLWRVSTTGDITIGTTSIAFALMTVDSVTAFIATLLDDGDSGTALATLIAAGTAIVNTFTMTQSFSKGADIASATTLVLGTDGNYFDVTGTTAITGITVTAGTLFMLQFDGILILTDGASFDLAGADILTATGDRALLFATAANTVQLITHMRESAKPLRLPTGYIQGLVLSNDAGDIAHDINVTAGGARNATDDGDLVLAAEQTKQLNAPWATGNDAGGLSSSLTVANFTWYHVFLVLIAGVVEVGFDTSVVAANLIADHSATKFRRIGSFITNGVANLDQFDTHELGGGGLRHDRNSPTSDYLQADPGITAITQAMTAPLGIVTEVMMSAIIRDANSAASDIFGLVTALDNTDNTPSQTLNNFLCPGAGGGASAASSTPLIIRTDLLSQIRVRLATSDPGITLILTTHGHIDSRR